MNTAQRDKAPASELQGAQHTETPWMVEPENGQFSVVNEKTLFTVACCREKRNAELIVRIANAHDELLEALQDMRKWVAAFALGANAHAVVMSSPRMAKANAAIAKAQS